MTREEAKTIIHIIVATYPNYKPSNLSETVDIWAMMLEEYSYNEIARGLKKYILTNQSGFAPSISQLLEASRPQTADEGMSEQQVWGMVYKAICNSNYNSEEEFNKLPEVVQKAVGNPANLKECASMNINDIQTIYQSQFLRSYRACKERAKSEAVIPASMRIENKSVIGIEGGQADVVV